MRKDGSQFPLFISAKRVVLSDGPLTYAFLIDFTERKRAEEELLRYRQHLEELVQTRTAELNAARIAAESASRTKSEFLSSMSHELRTPLNAILGFGQLLEMGENLTEEQLDYAREIMQAGTHLLELVSEVLDLSKLDSGKTDLLIEPVNCSVLAESCLLLVTPLAKKQGITIEIGQIGGLVLCADRVRLKQVVLNLLTNAIKYNRPNGRVWLHAMAGNQGRMRLAVSDTGYGIAADKLPMLFQPFNRLGAEHGVIEGTGIGLVISQRIVGMMGGKIGVESEEAKGSTFWIELPST